MALFYRQLTHFRPMAPKKRQHLIRQKNANEVTVYANLSKIKRIGAGRKEMEREKKE